MLTTAGLCWRSCCMTFIPGKSWSCPPGSAWPLVKHLLTVTVLREPPARSRSVRYPINTITPQRMFSLQVLSAVPPAEARVPNNVALMESCYARLLNRISS